MEPAYFSIALPADPELESLITSAIASQGEPRITVSQSATSVLVFQAHTADLMLRSRVVQALEAAVGPDWHRVVRPLD